MSSTATSSHKVLVACNLVHATNMPSKICVQLSLWLSLSLPFSTPNPHEPLPPLKDQKDQRLTSTYHLGNQSNVYDLHLSYKQAGRMLPMEFLFYELSMPPWGSTLEL